MKILRWTWKVVTSLLAGCFGTARSTGTPERAKPSPVKEAIRYRKRAQVAEQKLEAAVHALSVIESRTHDEPYLDVDDLNAVAEPLESFNLDIHNYSLNEGIGWGDDEIHMAGNNHTAREVEQHIINLKRLLRTLRSKKSD